MRHPIRTRAIPIAVGLVAMAFAGCSQRSSADTAEAVTIKTFMFTPATIEVKHGTKLTWTNEDEILHTVTAGERNDPDGTFDGQLDGKGTSFSFTFDKPGTYRYFCSRHPGMDATVRVS